MRALKITGDMVYNLAYNQTLQTKQTLYKAEYAKNVTKSHIWFEI